MGANVPLGIFDPRMLRICLNRECKQVIHLSTSGLVPTHLLPDSDRQCRQSHTRMHVPPRVAEGDSTVYAAITKIQQDQLKAIAGMNGLIVSLRMQDHHNNTEAEK